MPTGSNTMTIQSFNYYGLWFYLFPSVFNCFAYDVLRAFFPDPGLLA